MFKKINKADINLKQAESVAQSPGQGPEAPAESWTRQTWRNIEGVFEAITGHPFLKGLTDGSLARSKFLFYLSQDALYLDDFGKVLAGIALKSSRRNHVDAFLEFSSDTIKVERALHQNFLGQINHEAEACPSCLLYTSFMHRQLALGSLEIAVASVLPCFWIYQVVGEYILALKPSPGNPYQNWIDTYGGEEYGRAVNKALTIADELAAEASAETRRQMTRAFVACSKMEWMFWDAGWREESWPV